MARRVVENAVGILTYKFKLYYGRIQLSPGNADKGVLTACVLHSYVRNYVSVDDCVIENTGARLQFSYVTFRPSGGSVSEEAKRVRKNYRQYFENVGSVPWQMEAVRTGRTVQN
jgi:hypothetical protein